MNLNKQLICDVLKGISTLRSSEKEVIDMRFGLLNGEPKTLEQVGKEFGVIRERIRQIETKSIEKILAYIMQQRADKITSLLETNFYMDIKELNLKAYTSNALRRNKINTIEKLLTYTRDDLMNLPQIGYNSFLSIAQALKEKFKVVI